MVYVDWWQRLAWETASLSTRLYSQPSLRYLQRFFKTPAEAGANVSTLGRMKDWVAWPWREERPGIKLGHDWGVLPIHVICAMHVTYQDSLLSPHFKNFFYCIIYLVIHTTFTCCKVIYYIIRLHYVIPCKGTLLAAPCMSSRVELCTHVTGKGYNSGTKRLVSVNLYLNWSWSAVF